MWQVQGVGWNNALSDAITVLSQETEPVEIWEQIKSFFYGHGVDKLIYSFAVRQPSGVEILLDTTMSEAYAEEYQAQGFARRDPFFRLCCLSYEPCLTGIEHVGLHPELEPDDLELIRFGGSAGLRSGIAFPMQLSTSGSAGGWLIGGAFSRREFQKLMSCAGSDIRTYALYAHQHLQSARNRTRAPNPSSPLSARERECLLWLSRGYQTKRIADKLSISGSTVEFHFRNLRRKLGAETREAALTKALLNRYICP